MSEMIEFCNAMLHSVATFLATPPIFYLFCLVCLVPIVSIVRGLLRSHY